MAHAHFSRPTNQASPMSSLTHSALADHDKIYSNPHRPSKIQLPNPAAATGSRASNPSPTPSPPTIKSSYFPLSPTTSVVLDPSSSTQKPKLTPWQSHAHAFGTSAAQARFSPLSTPSIVPGSSQPLSTIAESASRPISSTRQQSHSKQPPPHKHYQQRDRSTSASPPHSYFNWTPGSQPTPIYDPDYPNGTPECISPRIVTKSPGNKNTTPTGGDYFSVKSHRRRKAPQPKDATVMNNDKDGTNPKDQDQVPLTMCELRPVHPYIGTVEDVFGDWFPSPVDNRTSEQLWLDMDKAKSERVKERRKMGSLDLSKRRPGARTMTTVSSSSTVGSRSGYSSTQPSSVEEDTSSRELNPKNHLLAEMVKKCLGLTHQHPPLDLMNPTSFPFIYWHVPNDFREPSKAHAICTHPPTPS